MAQTKQEQAKEELSPKRQEVKKAELSAYKIKDVHFNKTKTYLEKAKKGFNEKTIEANWRNINISGVQMAVFKNEPLTKKQHKAFTKEQAEYWLEKVK